MVGIRLQYQSGVFKRRTELIDGDCALQVRYTQPNRKRKVYEKELSAPSHRSQHNVVLRAGGRRDPNEEGAWVVLTTSRNHAQQP